MFWCVSFVSIKNETEDLWLIGHSVMLCIIFFVNFKLIIKTKSHNWISVILFLFSISSFLIVIIITNNWIGYYSFQFFENSFKKPIFYLTIFFILGACMMGEYAWENSLALLYNLLQLIKNAILEFRLHKEKQKKKSFMKQENEKNRKLEKENKQILEKDMSVEYKVDYLCKKKL